MSRKALKKRAKQSHNRSSEDAPVTILEHLKELQGRFFVVGLVFLLASAAAYPFFDQIVAIILAPLQSEHDLVYLTPAGAFSFMITALLAAGLVCSLPVFIYHLYRFLMPAMKPMHLRIAVGYTIASSFLAVAGILFVYFITLPAALQFLTGFDLKGISSMLTIDSYMSFVLVYLLAGAILFQLPLVMLIINGVTPLKPGGLMKHQGKIILGSFIVAAIVSPTPDAINQTLLAAPIVVMYQVGIVVIWIRNRRKRTAIAREAQMAELHEEIIPVQASSIVSPHFAIDSVVKANGLVARETTASRRKRVVSRSPVVKKNPSPTPRVSVVRPPVVSMSGHRSLEGMRQARPTDSAMRLNRQIARKGPTRTTQMDAVRPSGTTARGMYIDTIVPLAG